MIIKIPRTIETLGWPAFAPGPSTRSQHTRCYIGVWKLSGSWPIIQSCSCVTVRYWYWLGSSSSWSLTSTKGVMSLPIVILPRSKQVWQRLKMQICPSWLSTLASQTSRLSTSMSFLSGSRWEQVWYEQATSCCCKLYSLFAMWSG